jgi:ribosome-associated translation inhibitor RaiA
VQIHFHVRGLKLSPALRHRFEPPLERLQGFITISAAAVVLEHRRDDRPPFRAYASLAVPGPDIHADARDHTLEAAWLKVTTALRRQIGQRKSEQNARLKNNGHVYARAGRLQHILGLR